MKTHTEDEQLKDELRSKVWNHWRWGWNDALKDEWTPEQEAESKEIIEQWVTNLEKLITTLRLKDRIDENVKTQRLLNSAMQNDLGTDKPIVPEDVRNVMYDRYAELKQLVEEGE